MRWQSAAAYARYAGGHILEELKNMKILSLFDGMACGALAMQAAGIEVEKYIAYEVSK